jgi:peptidoglycan/LPS O-acetylase OafA/YrhL
MTYPHYPKSREIFSHTGLRGIAAMSVVLMHIYGAHSTAGWKLDHRIFQFFQWGDYAVDLFFILSGFILNWVYLAPTAGSMNWTSYLRARVARITPLYYVTSLVSIPALYISYLRHGSEYIHIGSDNYILVGILNILMFSGFLAMPTLNGPAWSISVEFFCYLALFPFLVVLYRYLVTKRYGLAAFLLIVVISIRLLVLCYHVEPIRIFHWHWDSHFLARGIFGFTAGFFLCAIYRMSSCWKPHPALTNSIIFAAVTVFICTQLKILPPQQLIYSLPFLIYFTAFDQGIAATLLKLNPLQWLGDRSYSIYLWHYPVLSCYPNLSKWFCARVFKTTAPFGLFNCLVLVIFVLMISELSYRYFEVPCREYIRRIRPKKSPAAT